METMANEIATQELAAQGVTMANYAAGLILALLVIAAVGLVGVLRAKVAVERLLAVQLIGSITTALLLLLSIALARPALIDVALLFALLAATAALAFTRNKDALSQTPTPKQRAVAVEEVS